MTMDRPASTDLHVPQSIPGTPDISWGNFEPFRANFLGVAAFDASDADRVRTYLNWDTLLQTWEIPVPFPQALDDADWGETARRLLHDANALLNNWLSEKKLQANVVFGVWRARAEGDQVIVEPEARAPDARAPIHLSFPRVPVANGLTYCAADFIKPTAAMKSGEWDYIGGYAIRLTEKGLRQIGRLDVGPDEYQSVLIPDLCAL